MDKIFEQIKQERERQIMEKDFDTTFDSWNSVNDWVAYSVAYLGRVTDCYRNQREGFDSTEEKQKMLLKAAALIVAAIESLDRGKDD